MSFKVECVKIFYIQLNQTLKQNHFLDGFFFY